MRGRHEERGEEEEETSEWEVFNFHHFTFLPFPLNFQCEQKTGKKKNREGLNVFFSVNYFKGPMKRLSDKRPLCLQADCILRSQIPAVASEEEEFLKCTFLLCRRRVAISLLHFKSSKRKNLLQFSCVKSLHTCLDTSPFFFFNGR